MTVLEIHFGVRWLCESDPFAPHKSFNLVDLVFNINLSHSLLTMLLTVEFTTILKLYLVAICSEITYEIFDDLVLSTLFLQSAPSEW